jgi:hypothetical protein
MQRPREDQQSFKCESSWLPFIGAALAALARETPRCAVCL